jgi:ATP diphosphatase
LDEALASEDPDAIEAELGDALFSLVNVARHAGVNPEMALRKTSQRFRSRFRLVEDALGDRLANSSLAEKEAEWDAAKRELEG